MNKNILRALTGNSGFNPKSLSPVFWLKDLITPVGGYWVDSSRNNKQIQAATTTVTNDSLIMPANDTDIINALILAHRYNYFYTDNATPKTVLISSIPIVSQNYLYFSKAENANFILFPSAQNSENNDKLISYIRYTLEVTNILTKTFTNLSGWSIYKTGSNVVESTGGQLHLLKVSSITTKGTLYASNKFTNGNYLRVTLVGVSKTLTPKFAIGANLATETTENQVYDPVTGVIDNIATLGQTNATNYFGFGVSDAPSPVGSELYVTSIQVDRLDYVYGVEVYDGIFDNSITYTDGVRSAKSEYSFNYDGTYLALKSNPEFKTTYPTWCEVQVLVNDAHNQYVLFAANNYEVITLPSGNKKVTLIETGLSKITNIVKGCPLSSIKKLRSATYTKISQGNVAEKYLFLGDSIVNGGSATHLQEGFANLFKITGGKEVVIMGWGSGTLAEFASTPTLRNSTASTIVTQLSNATKRSVIIEMGTNDAGLNSLATATFISYYTTLIEAINALDNTIKITCISPLYRGDETSLWDDYRTGIATMVSTRTSYCQHIAGKNIVTYPTNYDGLVHPTTSGHIELYNAVYNTIVNF